jgi:hypothetical protein
MASIEDFGLPAIPYDLGKKKKVLVLVAFLLLTEFALLPLILYYVLWFRSSLNHGQIFDFVTAFFGVITGVEYALRFWRLSLKSDEYRPIGGKRIWQDYFQLSNGVGASARTEPLTRVIAITVPCFLVMHGVLLLWSAVFTSFGWRTPIRLSSIPAGAPCVPITYTFVEDVMGVDAKGGKKVRIAWKGRYEASPIIQSLILYLAYFWACGMIVISALSISLVFTTPLKEVAFGIGWGVPTVWCILWTAITVIWVKVAKKREWKWAEAQYADRSAGIFEKKDPVRVGEVNTANTLQAGSTSKVDYAADGESGTRKEPMTEIPMQQDMP